MCLLILARHGNTFEDGETPRYVGARTDIPLTKKGEEQARALARELKLRGLTPTSFYAGPLKRQSQTAAIVKEEYANKTNRVEIEPALQEIDLGPWEGLTKEEIEKSWSMELAEWEDRFVWPDNIFGHSRQSREDSLRVFFSRIADNFKDKEAIFLATSNGVLRLVYSLFASDFGELRTSRNLKKVKVATGAFCLARVGPSSRCELLQWNIRPPLARTSQTTPSREGHE